MAMYRKMKGVSVFTGFVQRGEEVFKLHDVWGDLEGDSHKACELEFLSQMALYDGSTRYQKKVRAMSVESKDESLLVGKDLDGADDLFPFEGSDAKFRADDSVW